MADRPRLKGVAVYRHGAQVVICPRALRRVYLDDPTGSVAALLQLLSAGSFRTSQLRGALADRGFAVADDEITAALVALDELEVLEDADGDAVLDQATRARHHSNLRFYDLFARLDRTSASVHLAVERARVLLLGAGGLGSGVLQSLVGLGVGEVTIVDCDVVETKNLARQFVYGMSALGRPKVEAARDWAAAYSSGTRVVPVYDRVTDASSIVALGAGADVVICAIDSPDNIQLLVNEACFTLGVPFVTAGLMYSTLAYWSVEPGRTPCRHCLELHRADDAETLPPVLRQDRFVQRTPVNRATGPAVQLMSGLLSMEVMRYLTRIERPVAGATYQVIELADRLATASVGWQRHPDCPLCATVRRPAAPAVLVGR
jgi:molybdopterin/thiamine biosynthesis adenylyltransferase